MLVRDVTKCQNCPLRGDGSQLYVPDRLKPGAVVYLQSEQATPDRTPLDRVEKGYLPLAGLTPEQVSSGSAIRCTAELPKPVTNTQFEAGKRGLLDDVIRYCDRAHRRVGAEKLVVTQGDLALQAATGQRSAHEWRGWLLPYQPKSDSWLSEVWTPGPTDAVSVFAGLSLADVAAMPTLTYCTRADWVKVGRVLRGKWPQKMPEFDVRPPKQWPRVSAFDTEFDPVTGILERYSLYDSKNLWVVEASDIREIVIPDPVTVVMHNEDADIEHLRGFLKGASIKTEDTMLMHAALWSDLSHTLGFLGSIYAGINRWKHLFRTNPKVYSGGDAFGTWDVYVGLVKELKEDPATARVYREELYPLNAIISEATGVGLRTDQGRIQKALGHFKRLQDEVSLEAEAYAGYPLLLSSPDQVARHLFELEKVGVKKRGNRQRKGVA